jgi:hypothetical protein
MPVKAEPNPPNGCPQGCTDVEVHYNVQLLSASAWYTPCRHRDYVGPSSGPWRSPRSAKGTDHFCAEPSTEVQIGQADQNIAPSYTFTTSRDQHTKVVSCTQMTSSPGEGAFLDIPTVNSYVSCKEGS